MRGVKVSWESFLGEEGAMGGIGKSKGRGKWEGYRKERGEIPEMEREYCGKERGRMKEGTGTDILVRTRKDLGRSKRQCEGRNKRGFRKTKKEYIGKNEGGYVGKNEG